MLRTKRRMEPKWQQKSLRHKTEFVAGDSSVAYTTGSGLGSVTETEAKAKGLEMKSLIPGAVADGHFDARNEGATK